MKKRVHLVVKGRVQGVCFRMCACEEAARLGVTGWVRNMSDGSVEILAEGSEADLEALAAWCRRGPPYSRVTGVRVEYSENTGEFKEFNVSH